MIALARGCGRDARGSSRHGVPARRARQPGAAQRGESRMAANDADNKQAAAPTGITAAKPAEVQTASVRYVDRLECMETFADSINQLYFDGQSLRIEFGVTRLDEVKPQHPDHRPPLSGATAGADADGGGGTDQPDAAGRGGAGTGRRGQGDAEARYDHAELTRRRAAFRGGRGRRKRPASFCCHQNRRNFAARWRSRKTSNFRPSV